MVYGVSVKAPVHISSRVQPGIWPKHIRASRKMSLLNKTKHYFDSSQFSTIHIRSQMEYYSPLWDGAGRIVLGRLDRLQNRAVRLIRGS